MFTYRGRESGSKDKTEQKKNTEHTNNGKLYTQKQRKKTAESRGRNCKLWWKFKSLTQVTKPVSN